MKLEDYARSGKYLKWTDTNIHHIALSIDYISFRDIEPVLSDQHGSEQYEIPIVVKNPDEDLYESILATKSKHLLINLLNEWKDMPNIFLRLTKEGTGFYTKWTVARTTSIYDTVSGKVKRLPAKKK